MSFIRVSIFLLALLAPVGLLAETIRVKADADPANGSAGGSWADATNLQRALAIATPGDQVWVAAGVYYPDEGQDQTDDSRDATFLLRDGVEMYGGFAGTEMVLSERALAAPSVLSGDMQQNDVDLDGNGIAETAEDGVGSNCYIVVTGSGTTPSTILDGFTITAGRGNPDFIGPIISSGGMVISMGSPTVVNCALLGNQADYGGAISCSDSEAIFVDCTFAGNAAEWGAAVNSARSTLTFENCTVTGNSAQYGGAVNESVSNDVFIDCVLTGNRATSDGGAMYSYDSSPSLIRCEVSGNRAGRGGAFFSRVGSHFSLTSCTLDGNTASSEGGALYSGTSDPLLVNCSFTGNSADAGGALWGSESDAVLVNCAFIGNSAGGSGGALYHKTSSMPAFSNCVIWDNSASGSRNLLTSSVENASSSVPTFTNCIVAVSGGSGAWSSEIGIDGGGNLDVDPQFIPGSVWLQASSPAIDAGAIAALPADAADLDADGDVDEQIPHDQTGGDRVRGMSIDIGPVEFRDGPIANAIAPLQFSPGSGLLEDFLDLSEMFDDTASEFGLSGVSPAGLFSASVDPLTGLVDFTVASDAIGTTVVLFSATTDAGSTSLISVQISVVPPVVFVDDSATGLANGLSWQDAFPHLQDALNLGGSGYQIWVAAGVYHPDDGGEQTGDDDDATFHLHDDIALYGGFAGTETALAERDLAASHRTVLSGDIFQDDNNADGNGVAENPQDVIGTNSNRVITAIDVLGSAILDGFTVTAGLGGSGGGLYLFEASPSVSNCVFSGNRAYSSGGAVYLTGANSRAIFSNCTFIGNSADRGGAINSRVGTAPSFVDCRFEGCSAEMDGGAIYAIHGSDAALTNCQFIANVSLRLGGAIYNSGSHPVISDCVFSDNVASGAAAIYNSGSSPVITRCQFSNGDAISGSGGAIQNRAGSNATLVDCEFTGNRAEISAGALSNDASSPTVSGCKFIDNEAGTSGGAIYNSNSDAIIFNCLLARNTANFGGAVFNRLSSDSRMTNCTLAGNRAFGDGGAFYNSSSDPSLRSCILWDNSSFGSTAGSTASFYSGGFSDPTIFRTVMANSGTAYDYDPLLVPGSFRLQASSPAIDAGDRWALPRDTLDFDADGDLTELVPFDLADDPRVVGSDADIGAYESTGPSGSPIDSLQAPLNSDPIPNAVRLADHFDSSAVSFAFVEASLPGIVVPNVDPVSGAIDLSFPPDQIGTVSLTVSATDAAGDTSFLAFEVTVLPPVVFVDADAGGSNSGVSWTDAFTSLQDALTLGGSGYQIWVADGVYLPGTSAQQTVGNRHVSFELPSGVAIYGGFAGNESSLDQRDPLAATSVLSGDIDQDDTDIDGNGIAELSDDIIGENSYHVVSVFDTTDTILDGFTITAGAADGDTDFTSGGGGLYCLSAQVLVTDCKFSGHKAMDGGAIYLGAESNLSLLNCELSGNNVEVNGGAIRSDHSMLALMHCAFTENVSGDGGGAVYLTNTQATMTTCLFDSNSAVDKGGAVYSSISSFELDGCTLINNEAFSRGGALYGERGPGDITGCSFTGNSTTLFGGAVYLGSDSISLSHCEFEGNSARQGGGIHSAGLAATTLTDCKLVGNTASLEGGALFKGGGGNSDSLVATRCQFAGNSARSGGAIYTFGVGNVFSDCAIVGNSASNRGGGIYGSSSSGYSLNNCTISSNSAGVDGGAIYSHFSNATLQNCIVWGNTAGGLEDAISATMASSTNALPTYLNCLVANSGGSSRWNPDIGIDQGGNLDTDPQFVAPLSAADSPIRGGDYQLLVGSPAVDLGDNTATESDLDLAGFYRIVDGDLDGNPTVDIGAFELVLPNTDSDHDGFTDLFEHSVSGSPIDLLFPQVSVGFLSSGDQLFPSFSYQFDTRLEGLVDFTVESSSDLGAADPWLQHAGLLPISSISAGGTTRVELRAPDPIGTLPMEQFRLLVDLPD